MAAIYYEERDLVEFGEMSEPKWSLIRKQIKVEGIYVFGGMSGEKPEDANCFDDTLYVLTISKPHFWKRVETKGIKPRPRY